MAQTIKNLLQCKRSKFDPCQKDPLEKGLETPPLFLPGEVHGQRNLAGYSPWDHKELDITEWLTLSLYFNKKSCFVFLIKVVFFFFFFKL